MSCPWRNIRNGRRVLAAILYLEPANHDWAAAQQSLNLDSNGADAAFKFDGNEQSVRIVDFGLIDSNPFPRSGKLLAFYLKFESVDRQTVHPLPFYINLNVSDNLATRLPIAAHPTTVA